MFCIRCGSQLGELDNFCPNCGADSKKQNYMSETNFSPNNQVNNDFNYYNISKPVKTTGLLVWSILEILSCIAFIPGLIALILWCTNLKSAVTSGDDTRIKKAKIGVKIALWVGIVFLLPIIILFIIGIIMSIIKQPIDGNEFYDLLKNDYNVRISNESPEKRIYVADNGKYKIEFAECANENYAESLYYSAENQIDNLEGNIVYNATSVSFNGYKKYSSESNGMYRVVSQIDNTIVYAETTLEYKDEVKDVLKELGY